MTAAQEAKERARPRAAQPPPNGAHTNDAHGADPSGAPAPDSATAASFDADLERALADVKTALGAMPGAKPTPLFPVDGTTLLGKVFPDQQWLVTGLLSRGGVAIIGGPPKIARKTWLATEIAAGIATGTKVCGEFYAAAGSVAYFYAEDTERSVRNRLRALLDGADRQLAPGRFYPQPCGEFLDVTRDEDLARIIASARRRAPLDLLVLDPLRDISSAAEDKSDEMSPVMRRLRLIAQLLGCTVLVVHHSAKPSEATAKRSGGQQLRGSGAIHGAINCGIYMTDCDGDSRGTFTNGIESEVKGAQAAGRFTLELRIEDDDSGEAVRATWSCSRKSADKGPTKAERKAEQRAAGEAEDERKAFDFVRDRAMRGEHMTRRKLRSHEARPGIGERRLEAAINRLIDAGKLRLGGADGGIVLLPEPAQEDG